MLGECVVFSADVSTSLLMFPFWFMPQRVCSSILRFFFFFFVAIVSLGWWKRKYWIRRSKTWKWGCLMSELYQTVLHWGSCALQKVKAKQDVNEPISVIRCKRCYMAWDSKRSKHFGEVLIKWENIIWSLCLLKIGKVDRRQQRARRDKARRKMMGNWWWTKGKQRTVDSKAQVISRTKEIMFCLNCCAGTTTCKYSK